MRIIKIKIKIFAFAFLSPDSTWCSYIIISRTSATMIVSGRYSTYPEMEEDGICEYLRKCRKHISMLHIFSHHPSTIPPWRGLLTWFFFAPLPQICQPQFLHCNVGGWVWLLSMLRGIHPIKIWFLGGHTGELTPDRLMGLGFMSGQLSSGDNLQWLRLVGVFPMCTRGQGGKEKVRYL